MLTDALTDKFDGAPMVKAIDVGNRFNISTSFLIDDPSEDAADRVMMALYEGVNEVVGGGLNFDSFSSTGSQGTHIISSSQVGPTIAEDIINSSWKAVLFAIIGIFIYIFIRFSKWQDRKSTRLNSSHVAISYAVFCLKKKKQ